MSMLVAGVFYIIGSVRLSLRRDFPGEPLARKDTHITSYAGVPAKP